MFETARTLLLHPRFSAQLAHMLRSAGGADRAVDALLREFYPDIKGEMDPWGLSVDETLARVEQAALDNDWQPPGVAPTARSAHHWKQMLDKLRDSAPKWPKRPMTFRTLAISWGGEDGVNYSFRNHVTQLAKIFPGFTLPPELAEGEKRLSVTGDQNRWSTHAKLEWIYIDLVAGRQRQTVSSVLKGRELTHEMLTFAWLFPEVVSVIDLADVPAMFAGGYRVRSDEKAKTDKGEVHVQHVPYLTMCKPSKFDRPNAAIELGPLSSSSPDFSIPSRIHDFEITDGK